MNRIYRARIFTDILESIARELGLGYTLFSAGWSIMLSDQENDYYIHGYRFPLNSASAQEIVNDKHLCSFVLERNKIATIKHHLVCKSDVNSDYSFIKELHSYLDTYKSLVIKNPGGSIGSSVWKVSNKGELELAAQKVFSDSHSLCVSPFENIKNEYRCVVLDNEILLVYKKNIPYVLGDGVRNLNEILRSIKCDTEFIYSQNGSCYIPKLDEKIYLSWQHNLSKFAEAEILPQSDPIYNPVIGLALDAASAVEISFASVDVVETEKGELKIMEINSGVMMEKFAQQSDEFYSLACFVYKSAVEKIIKNKKS